MTKSFGHGAGLLIAAVIAGAALAGCGPHDATAFPSEWAAITGYMGKQYQLSSVGQDIDLEHGLDVAFFKFAPNQTSFVVLTHSTAGWRVVGGAGGWSDQASCPHGVSVNWAGTYVNSVRVAVTAGQVFGAWQGYKVDLHAAPGSQAAQHMPEHTYVVPRADGFWAAATPAFPSDVRLLGPAGVVVNPCDV